MYFLSRVQLSLINELVLIKAVLMSLTKYHILFLKRNKKHHHRRHTEKLQNSCCIFSAEVCQSLT